MRSAEKLFEVGFYGIPEATFQALLDCGLIHPFDRATCGTEVRLRHFDMVTGECYQEPVELLVRVVRFHVGDPPKRNKLNVAPTRGDAGTTPAQPDVVCASTGGSWREDAGEVSRETKT